MIMKRKSTPEQMRALFEKSGFRLRDAEYSAFWKYYLLLREHEDEDLTRLRNFEDIIIKHFIDSAYVTELIELPPSLLDIGTGAGFPGIPLKILKPDLRLILSEGRKRRVSFLSTVIDELALQDASLYPHMVSEHSFFDVAGVITRALEPVDKTLSRIAHFLPERGTVIFMKGPGADEELSALSEEIRSTFSLTEDIPYTLPNTAYDRRLLIFRKTSPERRVLYRILRDQKETIGHPIISGQNKTYRDIRKLVDVDGIRKHRKAIIAGRKQIVEMTRDFPDRCEALIIYDGYSENDKEINDALSDFSQRKSLYLLKKQLYNDIDTFKTKDPLLIARIPDIPEWDGSLARGCNLLIPFQDPNNVGAVIRSAVGFGVSRIILLREAAHPFHPRAIRSSGGAVFRAPLSAGPGIVEITGPDMRADIFTLDQRGVNIDSIIFPEQFLLLPGIEGPGLPEPLRANAIAIPIADSIESLNAAVATSIALYLWRRSASEDR